MKHQLLFLGKTKDLFIHDGISHYVSRIKHYTSIETKVLKDKVSAKTNASATVQQEKILLGAVPKGALKVVLDCRGRQFDSETFAKTIQNWELRGVKQVSYLIGGPEGHSKEMLKNADIVLSFSKMTFTHDMVRLFLAEQLYRAYTIMSGEKYHK